MFLKITQKNILQISAFFLLLTSFSSHAANLTFSQAWHILYKNNDGLAASQENKQKVAHLQAATKSLYLPKIDLIGGYSHFNDDISLSPSQLFDSMPSGNNLEQILGNLGGATGIPIDKLNQAFTSRIARQDVVSASINAVWPIYTGGRVGAAQDIAKAQSQEASYMVRIKQQALFEKLAKFYYGVILAKQVLDARKHAESGLYKHLSHSRSLEKQGQIAKIERLKAEASYDKAKVESHKAKRQLEIAQVALNQLLKLKTDVKPSNHLFINNKLPSLTKTTEATLNNHPGLGVLEAKRLQAEGLIKVKKGEHKPEVFLFGNYNLYEQDTLAADLAPDWMVGVGIKVSLSSRDGRSGKLKAARSTLRQVDLLKAQAVQDLSLLVEMTWREAQTALEEYKGLASSLRLAKENIRLRDKAYAQGLSTSLEVVDAKLFLVSVKTQRQAAAYRYVLSLARLLALSNQMSSFSNYQLKK